MDGARDVGTTTATITTTAVVVVVAVSRDLPAGGGAPFTLPPGNFGRRRVAHSGVGGLVAPPAPSAQQGDGLRQRGDEALHEMHCPNRIGHQSRAGAKHDAELVRLRLANRAAAGGCVADRHLLQGPCLAACGSPLSEGTCGGGWT